MVISDLSVSIIWIQRELKSSQNSRMLLEMKELWERTALTATEDKNQTLRGQIHRLHQNAGTSASQAVLFAWVQTNIVV